MTIRRLVIAAIRVYQKVLSPLLGPRCRFYPTCSHYTLQCVEMYDPWTAFKKSSKRLVSCHPFHPGGVDLP